MFGEFLVDVEVSMSKGLTLERLMDKGFKGWKFSSSKDKFSKVTINKSYTIYSTGINSAYHILHKLETITLKVDI